MPSGVLTTVLTGLQTGVQTGVQTGLHTPLQTGHPLAAVGDAVLAHGGAEGADLPPALTPARFFLTWHVEWVPLLALVLVGALYGVGVGRLHGRGDRWPVGRTAAFYVGLAFIGVATQGALALYDTTLLWTHMVQHMILNMAGPIFMALGAPITLALRTLPLGGRRTLLSLIHSRVAKVLTFPVVAFLIFVVNPFVLYFTGLYDATLRHPLLHDLNHLHFVLVGCLWFWVVIGIDPLPSRPQHLFRMLGVFATLPFHAILGVVIMDSAALIGGDWYADLHRTWGPTLAGDQRIAGGILWGTGDIVGLVVFGALVAQWAAASEREAAREDRRLDRLEAEERAAVAAPAPATAPGEV
ncbi:MAG: cytochrome c oxidase assembly protein [Motilibacteraceae bacterium]